MAPVQTLAASFLAVALALQQTPPDVPDQVHCTKLLTWEVGHIPTFDADYCHGLCHACKSECRNAADEKKDLCDVLLGDAGVHAGVCGLLLGGGCYLENTMNTTAASNGEEDGEDALAFKVEDDVTSTCEPDGRCVFKARSERPNCCSRMTWGRPWAHWSKNCHGKGPGWKCGGSGDAEDAVKLSEAESTIGSDFVSPTPALLETVAGFGLTANASSTCTATNKCELRGASCCSHSDHGTAACSRTWCETKCLAANVVKHCASKTILCQILGMGPEEPLSDLCSAVYAGICTHNQQHDTCKNECGKLEGKRCGSADVMV